MTGTFVNAAAIIAGSVIGFTARRRIPKNVGETAVKGIGLATILIGLKMALETQNPLITVGSLAFGALIGEAFAIEDRLEHLSRRIENWIGNEDGGIAQTFMTASLIFCIGPMAIMGSIEDGLGRTPQILYTKSLMDGIGSAIFASTLGIGVVFSAVPVLVYQGSITLAAHAVSRFLSSPVVAELTAAGGLLILAIGFNLVGASRLRVANLLPALAVAAVVASLLQK